VSGNTVIDAFKATAQGPGGSTLPEWEGLDPGRPWIFVTAHRRENHDAMPEIARALAEIAAFSQRPQILWPVHPSPRVAPIAQRILGSTPGVKLVAPMTYEATVRSVARSTLVLTDSGGLQEEAPCLGKPVLVMRRETERPEGIAAGTLELVGTDRAAIVEGTRRLLEEEVAYARMARAVNPYGDGHAAPRIVAWLLAACAAARSPTNTGLQPAPHRHAVEREEGSDLRAYYARKRTTAVWSLAIALAAGAALVPVSPSQLSRRSSAHVADTERPAFDARKRASRRTPTRRGLRLK